MKAPQRKVVGRQLQRLGNVGARETWRWLLSLECGHQVERPAEVVVSLASVVLPPAMSRCRFCKAAALTPSPTAEATP